MPLRVGADEPCRELSSRLDIGVGKPAAPCVAKGDRGGARAVEETAAARSHSRSRRLPAARARSGMSGTVAGQAAGGTACLSRRRSGAGCSDSRGRPRRRGRNVFVGALVFRRARRAGRRSAPDAASRCRATARQIGRPRRRARGRSRRAVRASGSCGVFGKPDREAVETPLDRLFTHATRGARPNVPTPRPLIWLPAGGQPRHELDDDRRPAHSARLRRAGQEASSCSCTATAPTATI